MTNTAFSERNFSFKAGLNRIDHGFDIYYSFFSNNIGILRSSHAVTAGDVVNAINNQIPNVINEFSYDIKAPKQNNNHNLIKLKLFKNFDFGKLIMGYDFQVNDRKEYDIRRGDDRDKPASDLNLQTHSISLDLNSKLTNTSNVKAGISARYQKNFPDPDTGIRRIIPDYKKYYLKINTFRRKFMKLRRTPFLKMTGCVPSYCTCTSREPQWRVPLGRTDPPRYSFTLREGRLST